MVDQSLAELHGLGEQFSRRTVDTVVERKTFLREEFTSQVVDAMKAEELVKYITLFLSPTFEPAAYVAEAANNPTKEAVLVERMFSNLKNAMQRLHTEMAATPPPSRQDLADEMKHIVYIVKNEVLGLMEKAGFTMKVREPVELALIKELGDQFPTVFFGLHHKYRASF